MIFELCAFTSFRSQHSEMRTKNGKNSERVSKKDGMNQTFQNDFRMMIDCSNEWFGCLDWWKYFSVQNKNRNCMQETFTMVFQLKTLLFPQYILFSVLNGLYIFKNNRILLIFLFMVILIYLDTNLKCYCIELVSLKLI